MSGQKNRTRIERRTNKELNKQQLKEYDNENKKIEPSSQKNKTKEITEKTTEGKETLEKLNLKT